METGGPEDVERKLQAVIHNCATHRAQKLAFCWENTLTRVPAEIGLLSSHLKELLLYKNSLTFLPDELSSLSKLEKLELSFNNLRTLIPGVGGTAGEASSFDRGNRVDLLNNIPSLAMLQELYLNNNQLNFLPQGLSTLTSLRILDLSCNSLRLLPQEIGYLTSLRTLNVHNNLLDALPPSIGLLRSLQFFLLSHNKISHLPPEIGALPIETLDLRCNRLSSLPSEIGDLSSLESLDLSENQLKLLPQEIGSLSRLQHLQLASNQISSLPADIEAVSSLQLLVLDNNPISILPLGIRQLRSLQILSVPPDCCTQSSKRYGISHPLERHTQPCSLLDTCLQAIRNTLPLGKESEPHPSPVSRYRAREREAIYGLHLPEDLEYKLLCEGRPCCGCYRYLYGIAPWNGSIAVPVCHILRKLELIYCASCGKQQHKRPDSSPPLNGNERVSPTPITSLEAHALHGYSGGPSPQHADNPSTYSYPPPQSNDTPAHYVSNINSNSNNHNTYQVNNFYHYNPQGQYSQPNYTYYHPLVTPQNSTAPGNPPPPPQGGLMMEGLGMMTLATSNQIGQAEGEAKVKRGRGRPRLVKTPQQQQQQQQQKRRRGRGKKQEEGGDVPVFYSF